MAQVDVVRYKSGYIIDLFNFEVKVVEFKEIDQTFSKLITEVPVPYNLSSTIAGCSEC